MFTVALLVETSRAYGRGICRGVARYVEQNPHWTVLYQERHLEQSVSRTFFKQQIHGILMRVGDARVARKIRQLGLPTVDLLGEPATDGCPVSLIDDHAVARMAVDSFLELGFCDFGYCGYPGIPFSDRREEHFTAFLRDAHYKVSAYPGKRKVSNNFHQAEETGYTEIALLAGWLQELPRPVGVFACNDVRALQLLQAAHLAKLHVPDEIAILGVDNDQVISDLCHPRLTSIQPNTLLTGMRACEMLDQLMRGQPLQTSCYLTAPIDVQERESTCAASTHNPFVNTVLKMIRQRACEGLAVKDILRALKVSRTHLESQFRVAVRRSVHEEIVRVRLRRVAQLLRNSDDTLAAIARQTGYLGISHLSRAFTKHFGRTPGAYRAHWHRDTLSK